MFIWLRILAPNFRPYFTLIQTPGIWIPWLTLIGTVCCYLNKWYNSCKGTYSSLLSIWLRVCKIRTQQIITIVLKTISKISRHAQNHVKSFKVCSRCFQHISNIKIHLWYEPCWKLCWGPCQIFQSVLKTILKISRLGSYFRKRHDVTVTWPFENIFHRTNTVKT